MGDLAPLLRALGCKHEDGDNWVEQVIEQSKKECGLQALHPRSPLWIWWLDGSASDAEGTFPQGFGTGPCGSPSARAQEPSRITATRLVASEIALTTKLAILRVSSGELGNHAQAIENSITEPRGRETLPGLLISPHTSKWCNVTRFGRNSSRQTLLPDWPMSEPIASRSHFNIIYRPEEERFYLLDASSKWGTFVKLTQPVPLCCGDWIRVGGVEFVVRFCGGSCAKAKTRHQHYRLHALRLTKQHVASARGVWAGLSGAGGRDYREEVMTSLLESRRRAIPQIPPSAWLWHDDATNQENLPLSWSQDSAAFQRDEDDSPTPRMSFPFPQREDEVKLLSSKSATAPIRPLELEFISGPPMGERITVTTPVCTLGRADGNGVQVNDSQLASVSRVHCTFQFLGDRWYLHDNKSTNGTWRRLSCVLESSLPVPLDHGVAIQAGTHQFEVEVFTSPFLILPSSVQEVMLKCVGLGSARETAWNGGPQGQRLGKRGSDQDSRPASEGQSAHDASAVVSVNATVGSHDNP